MSRWSTDLDSPVIPDGDRFFNAYNSKLHRSILPEGTVPVSVNKRFTDNRASPRKGSVMPPGNSNWYRSQNDQKFVGSFVYTNPVGQERIILVPTNVNSATFVISAYDINNDRYFQIVIPPPNFIPAGASVWFAQSFGTLVMLCFNGHMFTGSPQHITNGWFWTGDESPSGAVFQPFQWNNTGTTQVIPPSVFAWPISNRMAYAISYLPPTDVPAFSLKGAVFDHLLISDVFGSETGAFQNMDPALNDFLINTGTTDSIVTMCTYAFDTAIVFMNRSICMLSNFSIDPTLAQLQILTTYMGCAGPRAALQIGSEVYFMSERRGVFRLTQVLDQQLVVPSLPISDDIQPDIDRINWNYQNQIILAAEDNYLYVAAPIDGSKVNNAIFVMNLTTGKWETIDQFSSIPNFGISNLLVAHINGVRRLIAVQNGPPALIYLLYEGTVDQTLFNIINPVFAPVTDYMETRGYGIGKDADPSAWGTFHRGSAVIETVNPNVQITAITEGVGERKIVRKSITKNPSQYYVHGVPPNSPAFDDEKRQDYSLSITQPDNVDAQDFEQMPVGDISLQGGFIPPVVPKPGISPWSPPPQTSRERFKIRMTDRWLSLGIGNTQGTCTVVATNVELTESKRSRQAA